MLETASSDNATGTLFGIKLPDLKFSHLLTSTEDQRLRSLNTLAGVFAAFRQDTRLSPLRYWVANMQTEKGISYVEGRLKSKLEATEMVLRKQELKLEQLVLGAACMKTFFAEASAEEAEGFGQKIADLEAELQVLHTREVRRELDRAHESMQQQAAEQTQAPLPPDEHLPHTTVTLAVDPRAAHSIMDSFYSGLRETRGRREQLLAKADGGPS